MDEINKKIAKGAAWMVSFKMLDRSIGLASTIVLARLLMPADFGLVAMAMSLIGALQLLGAFGLDIQLIQNPKAGRDQFDTAWTFNVLFALFCASMLAMLASPAAHFYSEPRLEAVIYLLAFGCGVGGFSNIGPVIFRREMRFDKEFNFLLSKRLAGVLVTVSLALFLRNYWALIAGQLTTGFISVLLSYHVSSYRPRFSLKAKSELFHASKWLMANQILFFLNGRASEFLIGRFAGTASLGTYTISSEIASLPTTELVAPINRAAFPGYARVAHDNEQLRTSFLRVISMIALFTLPAGIGIASIADLMVPAILGWQWQAAIPLVQILAIYSIIMAMQTNIGYIYLAVGRTRTFVLINLLQFIVLLSLMLPALRFWGVSGAAYAFLASYIIMIPVNQTMIARQLQLSVMQYLKKIWRPFIAGIVMALGIYIVKINLQLEQKTASYLFALMLCVASGAAIYASVLYGLWCLSSKPGGAERDCLSTAEKLLYRLGFKISLAA